MMEIIDTNTNKENWHMYTVSKSTPLEHRIRMAPRATVFIIELPTAYYY